MIKFTKEIALITAVSDRNIFFDIEKEVELACVSISSLSDGEKSPSGPINIIFTLPLFKFFSSNLFLELTSANDQVGFTSGFDYYVSSSFKEFH